MRVLHVIPTLRGGGAERQLVYLAGGLRTLGCDVHVATLDGGTNLRRLEATQATLHHLNARGNYDPRIVLRLVQLIRRIKPDVVQTWITQMDVFGGLAALLTGTPWILSDRSSGAHYERNLREALRRMIGRHAKTVIANSEPGLHGWEDVRGLVIRNAVMFDEIEQAPRDTTDYGDAKVVLFAGRLGPEKNVPTLLHAVREVMAQRDVIALLCGTGPNEKEIHALVAEGPYRERIHLLGFCENLPSLMKRADMLVAPSWYEGHPNVSIEAAAAGCPLVVSDIPAHRGWLDDDSALFAPPDDPHAFALAIMKTLDEPEATRRRVERARELVSGWSLEAASTAYFRVYEELRAERAGA
ncbi:MAG: glycosyltransferase [Thermoanaerobaculia bacterium]